MPKPLSPPSISPIAASSEEQKEYEDNKNEVHIFLPKYRIFSPVYMGAELLFTSLGAITEVVEIIYTGHADRDDVWATSLQKLAPIGDRHGIEFLRCDYRCELNIATLSTAHAWTVPNRAAHHCYCGLHSDHLPGYRRFAG